MRQEINLRKIVLAFFITITVFVIIYSISKSFDQKRFAEIRTISDKIYYDILSSEAQYSLVKESSCDAIDYSTAFSDELNDLYKKISYMDEKYKSDNPELISLKKYFTLLEVKDYLLITDKNNKCKNKPVTVLFFYNDPKDCEDCKNMKYIIDALKENYPEIKVYVFDNRVDLSVLSTLKIVFSIDKGNLPATVVGGKVYRGFIEKEAFYKLIPEIAKIDKAREIENSSSTPALKSN